MKMRHAAAAISALAVLILAGRSASRDSVSPQIDDLAEAREAYGGHLARGVDPPASNPQATPATHIARPPTSLPDGDRGSDDTRDAGVPEDQLLNAGDTTPELRQWRGSWSRQYGDAEWTQSMQEQIVRRTREGLNGSVQVEVLSCRETLCRMILKFADDSDAMAYQDGEPDDGLHYEYQPFDPDYDGAPGTASDHRYEVMVHRPSPSGAAEPTLKEVCAHAEVTAEPEVFTVTQDEEGH